MDKIVALYISFAIAISVIFVTLLILFARTKADAKVFPTVQELELGKLKTGDMIVVSYKGARMLLSEVLTGSKWVHTALVYIEPKTGEVQVIEAANYNPPYKGQIIKVPLLYWIRVNMNVNAIAVLSLNKAIPSEIIDESYQKFIKMNIGVQSFDLSWTRFFQKKTDVTITPTSIFSNPESRLEPKIAREIRKNESPYKVKKSIFKLAANAGFMNKVDMPEDYFDYMITCTELVVSMLQDAGVYSKEFTPCSYLPMEIMKREIKHENGYKYDIPRIVSVSSLAENAIRLL